jgi:urease accessory protein
MTMERQSHLGVSILWVALVALAALALAVLSPTTAYAHTETGAATGFLSGLQHPISGWDHILAMIAVGLWGAQLGAPAVWALPVAFPMAMAFGGMIGLMGLPLPGVEIGIAISALVLGGMVLTECRPPLWVAAVVVGFFALFHGHAHGTELPPENHAMLYSMGFVMATGSLHRCGIALGLRHRWKSGRLTIRAAGTCVAAGGIFFLWKAFT